LPFAPAAPSAPVASLEPQVATNTAAPAPQLDEPPVWERERTTKPGTRRGSTASRGAAPLPKNAESLRASGYRALQNSSYAEAFWQLQEATLRGDAYASLYIGEMFENGLGVRRDPGQASYWYGIAVGRGNAAALTAFQQLRMTPY